MPAGVDSPLAAMDQAAQTDLVQRKIRMDNLRARLGDTKDEQQKLRESCEGFESIFLQKMWEQMRKNVSKEGYLHSKDEEAYQSMFDVELCKKMTAAGGIGLADMLYEQLTQKLDHAGRATTPGTYRAPVSTPTASAAAPQTEPAAPVEKLTAENLYSEPEPERETPERISGQVPAEAAAQAGPEAPGIVEAALAELRSATGIEDVLKPARAVAQGTLPPNTGPTVARGTLPPNTGPTVARGTLPPNTGPVAPQGPASPRPVGAELPPELAAVFDANLLARQGEQGMTGAPAGKIHAPAPAGNTAQAAQTVGQAAGEAAGQTAEAQKPAVSTRRSRAADNPRSASWIGHGPVSAEPKPLPRFKRPDNPDAGAPLPDNAALPAEGRVVGDFGWVQEGGRRRWNNGLDIAAAPGSPVRACLDGTVAFVGEQQGMGSLVVLEHAGGLRSYYSGIQAEGLAEGAKIPRGANFARIASQPGATMETANSALLHFEIKRGEMALNPESILDKTT